jgi:hypothetical protein
VSIDDRTARLAGVRERLAKATPGGWVVQSGALCPRGALVGSLATDEWFVVVEPHAGGRQYADGWVEPFVPQAQAEADAALIANAPADLAFLLALADEQAAEIEAGRTREAALAERLTRQSEAHAAENERLERRRAFWAWAARRLYRKGLAATKDHRGWYERAVTAEDEIERLEGQAAAAESSGAERERARIGDILRDRIEDHRSEKERHRAEGRDTDARYTDLFYVAAARQAEAEDIARAIVRHPPEASPAPEEGARGEGAGHAVPDGVAAWRCSSCGFWCSLIENANHHANRTGHAFTHDPGADGTRSRDGHYADMVAALLGVPRG